VLCFQTLNRVFIPSSLLPWCEFFKCFDACISDCRGVFPLVLVNPPVWTTSLCCFYYMILILIYLIMSALKIRLPLLFFLFTRLSIPKLICLIKVIGNSTQRRFRALPLIFFCSFLEFNSLADLALAHSANEEFLWSFPLVRFTVICFLLPAPNPQFFPGSSPNVGPPFNFPLTRLVRNPCNCFTSALVLAFAAVFKPLISAPLLGFLYFLVCWLCRMCS